MIARRTRSKFPGRCSQSEMRETRVPSKGRRTGDNPRAHLKGVRGATAHPFWGRQAARDSGLLRGVGAEPAGVYSPYPVPAAVTVFSDADIRAAIGGGAGHHLSKEETSPRTAATSPWPRPVGLPRTRASSRAPR